ncbi:putative Heat shock protein Hsp20 [Nitrospira sp. KM1]|uniref:Hsp20/alpha crystallin family protein n=1 Tax=Nitrospira sp. KM1 TaxID=1936990 RepID=UPI0013A7337F|nr:Hsp20/alpha crystallin family protein [Nitrospira sp. KM1]BCA56033.1 putative Heat shock protein Hsp20 [Nitrospira sp. KM1]
MTGYIPAVLNGQIDQILDEALRGFTRESTWSPASNVWEDDKGFYVQLALPGWEPKDVSLEVEKQVLTVKGAHKTEADSTRKVYQWETAAAQFSKRYRLPDFANQEQASAVHKNGMLTVSFPKREEAKPRRIEIQG